MQILAALLALAVLASPAGAAFGTSTGAHGANTRLSSLGGMIKRSIGWNQKGFVVPSLGGKYDVLPKLHPGEISLYYPETHGGGLVPSVWDPSRAAALLDLASERSAFVGAPPMSGLTKAPALLEAINSVLRDIPAEELKDLPPEKLEAALGLVFDQLDWQGRLGSGGDAVKAIETVAQARLKKLQGIPYERKSFNGNAGVDHAEVAVARGLPKGVGASVTDGTVYRHYTTEEGLESILASKSLKNGILPYIHLIEGVSRTTFKDLSGIFLTLPETAALTGNVLAEANQYFVDLVVPGGLPLLQIEKDRIYLVPLPGRAHGWVLDHYRNWLDGKSSADGLVQSVDEEGGAGPELLLPIEIVGHGLAGVNGNVGFWSASEKTAGRYAVPEASQLTASVSAEEAASAKTPTALLAALKRNHFLKDQYAQVVVKEGYTLEEHSLMVMGQFEKYRNLPLPASVSRDLFRAILALHDIGKPAGMAEGGPKRQHAHTVKIMSALLPHLGYGPADVAKAAALVGADLIGKYLRGGDVVETEKAVREAALKAGMSPREFFEALVALYKVDAGAYTKDAGGRYSLDELFDFDKKAKTIRMRSQEGSLNALASRFEKP